MRILKYIIIWIVLLISTLSVFVVTQPDLIGVAMEKKIVMDRKLSFQYINCLKYWPHPSINVPVNKEDTTLFHFDFILQDQQYLGVVQKRASKPNKEIKFSTLINNVESLITINFLEKENKTVISWKLESNLNYLQKLTKMFGFFDPEKTAQNFLKFYSDELIQKMLSDFNFKSYETEGIVNLASFYAITRDTIGKKSDLEQNKIKLISSIQKTLDTISVKTIGKPILSYHLNKEGYLQTQVQIKIEPNEITSHYPDLFKYFEEENVLKLVFFGDVRKRTDLEKIIKKEIIAQDLIVNNLFKIMSIDRVNQEETKMPFEWITEFYIPVMKKQRIDTTVTNTNATPAINNIE